MRRLLRFGAGFILLASTYAVSTTCLFHRYLVTGRVTVPPGVSPAAVRIYVFLEGTDSTSAYLPEVGEHDYAVPAQDGAYRFTSYFSTRNPDAKLPWQSCNRRAHYADVILLGEGLRAKRIRVTCREARGEQESGISEYVVKVPTAEVEALQNAPSK